jgi:hypothetical protein
MGRPSTLQNKNDEEFLPLRREEREENQWFHFSSHKKTLRPEPVPM